MLGSWSCDLGRERISWDTGVYSIFGIDPGHRLDRRETLGFYDEPCRETLERVRGSAILAARPFTLEARIRRNDGQWRWMRITAMPQVVEGRTLGIYGVKQDITAECEEWETLRRLAYHDALTGLANRTAFHERFLDQPRGGQGMQGLGALVLFDLDGFKAINDRWGHLAGDACLVHFARRLRALFPDAVQIARLGGDEFAVLLRSDARRDRIALAARLARAAPLLAAPFPWHGEMVAMGTSSGFALTPAGAFADPEEIFTHADAVLYRDKTARRG